MSVDVCKQCATPAEAGRIFCKQCGATLQQPVALTELPDPSTGDVPQVRPWVRYWARMFDLNTFGLLLGIVQIAVLPHFLGYGMLTTIGVSMVVLFLWVFVESTLLSWFGTTPGKSLFKTRLLLAGNRSIPFSAALTRSFKVWWRGLAAGIPIISLMTLTNADNDLTKESITSWDREGGFVVVHEKISSLRTIIAVAFFALFGFIGILVWLAEVAR